MSIKFSLVNNPLTPDPRNCRAQVVSSGPVTLSEAIDLAVKRGRRISRTDFLLVSGVLFEVLTDLVAEGHTVITPLSRVRPSIKGAFDGEEAAFDAKKHDLGASHTSGALLLEKLAKAKVEKVRARSTLPHLSTYTDRESQTVNTEISPGGMAILAGERLKFDTNDPEQGVFFVDAGGTETRASGFMDGTAKHVIFCVPSGLPGGEYKLILRTRFYSRKMRSGQMGGLEVK